MTNPTTASTKHVNIFECEVPLVGHALVTDGEAIVFDTAEEASEFQAMFGGTIFPVVNVSGVPAR